MSEEKFVLKLDAHHTAIVERILPRLSRVRATDEIVAALDCGIGNGKSQG
jgi:hypothetical protein